MATYPLILTNPAITKGDKAVVFTGDGKPNSLELTVQNKSGFQQKFTPDKPLILDFPSTIISYDNIKKLTVDAAWKITAPDPIKEGTSNPYSITLTPVSTITFDVNAKITITLAEILPTKAGNGPLKLSYPFALGTMISTATLTCNALPKPDNQTLLGPIYAVSVDVEVEGNSGGTHKTNKIEPSVKPINGRIKETSIVENRVTLMFAFHGENNKAKPTKGYTPSTELIEKQGTSAPRFTIRFPYSNAAAQIDQIYTLTDNSKRSDDGYLSPTSGRNIDISLSSTVKGVMKNTWWTILPPDVSDDATAPVWTVEPTGANQHFLTSIDHIGGGPGPTLNIYLSNICTTLDIFPPTPQTAVFVQSLDFPGFNDQMTVHLIEKDPVQKTKSFSAAIQNPSATPSLQLDWLTQNTTTVEITGVQSNSAVQGVGAALDPSGPLTVPISVDAPVLCEYTLTSYNAGRSPQSNASGNGKISATWAINPAVGTEMFGNTTTVATSPDGGLIYMPGQGADVGTPLYVFNTSDLSVSTKKAFDNNLSAVNVAPSPDAKNVYVVLKNQQYQASQIVQLTAGSLAVANTFTGLPGGIMTDGGSLVVSSDSKHLAYSSYTPGSGSPRVMYLDCESSWTSYTPPTVNVATMKNRGLAVTSEAIFHSDTGGLGYIGLTPTIATSSKTLTLNVGGIAYESGPMSLSPDGSRLAIMALPQGRTSGGKVFFVDTNNITLETLSIDTPISFKNGFILPGLTFSVDGKYLFVSGSGPSGSAALYTYSTSTGLALAPVQSSTDQFGPVSAQPTGVGVFVLNTDSSQMGRILRLNPTFAPFSNPNS
ncbi:hypothetical protein [uncultured Tateyamaria sp.]|uniref:hypothetical protein n=1 Tax=uncultured Tateyamaria sp. TaxID=455651 RepID=UPI00260A91D7|nr:hypothetical protein [uncultured Tateyamaria sp.]